MRSRKGQLRSRFSAVGLLAFWPALGCAGEPLPPIHLDPSSHSRCAEPEGYSVDASASEIQCVVEDYLYISYADETELISEDGMNVPGPPVCCEVCALEDSADEACDAMCKYSLCDRARDEHYVIGQGLGTCALGGCGFDFARCMDTNLLHVQWIDLNNNNNGEVDVSYGLRAKCRASAADPVRPDGLFRYLDGLDGVPGARGALANEDDVVGYCLDRQPEVTGGGLPPATTNPGGDSGADSTGASEPAEPPSRPPPCGSYADRSGVRPSSNVGTWNSDSAGLGPDAETSFPITVIGGGLAYTLLPCTGATEAQCLRFDQLSVDLLHADTGLVTSVSLVQNSGLMPISTQGDVDVPPGALRLAVRYVQDGRRPDDETLSMATNAHPAHGHVDATGGLLSLTGITATSDDGASLATLSLHADLNNTQPTTAIVQAAGSAWNRVALTAETFDAEHDPIVHQWMIPGVGVWHGEHIEVELPVGRHPVILRADDVHRSRGLAATWVEITPSVP